MNDVTITVQGRHAMRRPAERGTLRMSVQSREADRDAAMAEVVESAASVRALLTGGGDAVRSWSADDVRTWLERPWSPDGSAADPVFHAQVDFLAVLSDFDRLARVVDSAAVLPGVTIHGLEWALTDESTAAVLDEARWKAVTDAAAKATTYASAIGRQTVVPVAVADAGMLDGSAPGSGAQPVGMLRSAMAAASDSSGISLTPQPIEVAAVIDARFTAS